MESEQPANFNVHIEGDVQAQQVAIGNNILQIGSIHGGILNVLQPGTAPKLTANPPPVFIRPRRVRDFHGRDQEWQQARRALLASEPKHLEIYGGPQSGKSTFLRFMAHERQLADSFSNGLIYQRTEGQLVEDIAQFIFDAFYVFESPIPIKPTAAQLRQALQSIQALLLLDDFELEWRDVDHLLDLMPEGTFALASNRSQPVGQEFVAIHLENLPQKQVTAQSLQVLSREEKRILLTMAAFGGRPMPVERLNHLTQIGNTLPFLQHLETLDKVEQLADGRYRLPNHMSAALAAGGPLSNSSTEKAKDEIRQRTLTGAFLAPVPFSLADWDMVQYVLDWAGSNHTYSEAVISLCRQAAATLAGARRWGAWDEVLRHGLQAARQLGDAPAEAWFRHQLGTRAFMMALATPDSAQVPQLQTEAIDQLESALKMRQVLQDRAGAAVTRNQLNHIRGFLAAANEAGKPIKTESAGSGEAMAAAGGNILSSLPTAVFLGFLILATIPLLWLLGRDLFDDETAVTEEATSTARATESDLIIEIPVTTEVSTITPEIETNTPIPIITDTASPTPTSTQTPTLTPTSCAIDPPADWVSTTIVQGNTLFGLANLHGTTIGQIIQVNCLANTNISAGSTIYLPELPTSTPTPTQDVWVTLTANAFNTVEAMLTEEALLTLTPVVTP